MCRIVVYVKNVERFRGSGLCILIIQYIIIMFVGDKEILCDVCVTLSISVFFGYYSNIFIYTLKVIILNLYLYIITIVYYSDATVLFRGLKYVS